jgi:hypothetical protein
MSARVKIVVRIYGLRKLPISLARSTRLSGLRDFKNSITLALLLAVSSLLTRNQLF